jgi:hypothetical protein
MLHNWRLSSRHSTGRGNRVGSLASVASVRELMIMEATSQLSLFQVRCNVLVGHFLKSSLKEVNFLFDD